MSLAAAGQCVGRFTLQRVLGRGAQATVWLAHDSRLDRPVALKLLHSGADSAALHEWLDEAKAVSRLAHPGIVPVFEADHHAGQPYLVFEYVDGQTLADAVRQAQPARQAVGWMIDVLDALATAHAQGIVHRDLKPSNILLGKDGRARVMDFGIAARRSLAHDGRIVGTPGYISPEAARGAAPAPAMDLFAAGVMLGELLCGQRLLLETDPMRALQRVQNEDLQLPAVCAIDDALRALVQRCLARDAGQRPAGAEALRDALKAWLNPPEAPGDGGGAAGGGHGTLDFLLRRMRHKSDFPALSASVARIQRLAMSDSENLHTLAEEILKDVALTNKLLRLVNTAHFQRGSGIQTISRAVALVGFAGIRNLALSLVLLEHMQDKAHAAQLVEEFLRALMAATLAGELASSAREREEVFIGAMFQNLGRLLTGYYFPEEAAQIRQQGAGGQGASAVLGMSFDELGLGVARSWGLPEGLLRCMQTPLGDVPSRAVSKAERPRWLARAANDLTEVLLSHDGAAAVRALAATAERHGRALALEPRAMLEATSNARVQLAEMARAMNLSVPVNSPARRMLAPALTKPGDSAGAPQADATLVLPRASDGVAAAALSQGVQDITNCMAADDFKLNDLLLRVLTTMHQALGLRRVVFCMRDNASGALVGRFGVGLQANELAPLFRIELRTPPGAAPDLFATLCLKGADTLIEDARSATVAARLPAWYAKAVQAPAFVLLPLLNRGVPFGLIYADQAQAGNLGLAEKELALVRTLRNQAVMAFKQAA